jgi:hypothetical protein
MADIRTLKLALLADTKDFISGLDKATKESRSFSDKLDAAVMGAAKAFVGLATAAGAAAIKIGIDAVQAAIEDQKAQVQLAQALKNTTNATDAQVAAVEDYIDATARASGVADDQLRPSLERLLRSTSDITKAQQLQKIALDVAAGTGKDLASVSDALSRAYEGQYKGLKDLGLELKTSITTTKKVTVSKKDLEKAEISAEGATLRVQAAQERLNKVLNNSKSDALDVARAQNALDAAQQKASESADKFEKAQSKVGKSISTTKEVAVPFDDILKQLQDKFGGQAAAAAETFAGRMNILKISIDEAKEQLGFALLPIMERFAGFVTREVVPAIEGLVDGLTRSGKQSLTRAFYDVGTGAVTFGYDMNTTKGQAYLLGEQIRLLTDTITNFSNTALKAAEGEGLKKLLTAITSIIDSITRAIDLYNLLPDVGKLVVNPVGQVAPLLSPAGSLISKTGQQVVNIYNNVKGAIDPQATARAIVKVTNTATATTGLRAFNY